MNRLLDVSINIRERLSYVLSIASIVANTVGFLANLALFGFYLPTIICGGCALFIIVLSSLCISAKRTNFLVVVILLLINIGEFPFLYYVYGNSTIVYMVLGCMGIMIFMKKSIRNWFLGFVLCLDAVTIFLRFGKSSAFGVVDETSAMGATLCSYIIVVLAVGAIIYMWHTEYSKQEKELRQLNQELQIMAEKDPLTLAYNRRYLTDYLDYLMGVEKKDFGIALLDLDNFKNINDNFGHVFGDKVLVEFCKIVQGNIGAEDILARYGGEEFMIVFREDSKHEIEAILDHIKECYSAFSLKEKNIEFTFSGGAEIFTQKDEIVRLFNAVDKKLYQAKNTGRNRIIWK